MKILEPNLENLKLAGEELKNGKLVVIPTETVYGLGADALNPTAVANIFAAKKRPFFDPLIVHIADRETLEKIAVIEGEKAEKMIKAIWPGPLTMIFKKKECVPDIITSGLDSVAVRMPSNKYALEIIKKIELANYEMKNINQQKHLLIGSTESNASTRIIPFLLELNKDFPNMTLELITNTTKEITKKIVNGEGKEAADKTKSLTGLDLKVGGEGMKAFYDAIVPSAMSKLGKPFGAKVETIEIPETEPG